jgi:hypothetical protein
LGLADLGGGKPTSVTPLGWFGSTDTRIERGLICLVLDRQCVDCHAEKPEEAPSLARGDW